MPRNTRIKPLRSRGVRVTKAVIPAAGLGTRFLPATKAQPKEMLPVYDKPAIQYVVEEAVAAGIRDILIITGRGKQSIENHFDRSWELEENLRAHGKSRDLKIVREISSLVNMYFVRQKEALGLGHAVLCAKSFVGSEPFAVFLGDDIMDSRPPAISQLLDVWDAHQGPVLGVMEVPRELTRAYGIIRPKEMGEGLFRVEDLVEKPEPDKAPSQLGIVGRYILTPDLFEILEKTRAGRGGEIQLTDALRILKRRRPIYACALKGHRHDIGNKVEFVKATLAYALKDPEARASILAYARELVAEQD
ncbi:MAG: UTP--glucose-1-phosphate uridylyltransferase GalU [Candidatus Firestonebacteria bacterium]|nr:UTP--glucose-1-phosphate uridylyltransferase GalU [Candidatus Firestonebacteria bacterium]